MNRFECTWNGPSHAVNIHEESEKEKNWSLGHQTSKNSGVRFGWLEYRYSIDCLCGFEVNEKGPKMEPLHFGSIIELT